MKQEEKEKKNMNNLLHPLKVFLIFLKNLLKIWIISEHCCAIDSNFWIFKSGCLQFTIKHVKGRKNVNIVKENTKWSKKGYKFPIRANLPIQAQALDIL